MPCPRSMALLMDRLLCQRIKKKPLLPGQTEQGQVTKTISRKFCVV